MAGCAVACDQHSRLVRAAAFADAAARGDDPDGEQQR
jgi:hypothetical protein